MDKEALPGILRAIVESIAQKLWEGLSGASLTEQLATLTGVAGVWLMIRRSLWAFPVGLVQVSLSAVVFHSARFYADMKLQGVFFVVLAYGWWHWVRGAGGKSEGASSAAGELPVTRLAARGWLLALIGGVAGTCAWGAYLAFCTDAAMPYRDSFIASFSVVAQVLQARKKLENWLGWMVVNATAVPVYWLGGMPWFSLLYLLFLLMAVGGWCEWRRALKACAASGAAPEGEVRHG